MSIPSRSDREQHTSLTNVRYGIGHCRIRILQKTIQQRTGETPASTKRTFPPTRQTSLLDARSKKPPNQPTSSSDTGGLPNKNANTSYATQQKLVPRLDTAENLCVKSGHALLPLRQEYLRFLLSFLFFISFSQSQHHEHPWRPPYPRYALGW